LLSSYNTQDLNPSTIQELLGVHFGDLTELDDLNELLDGFILDNVRLPGYAHKEFTFESLGEALELALLYEESHGNKQIRDYCSQMITRFKWINEREEFAFLRYPPSELASHERDQNSFVDCLIGNRQIKKANKSQSQIVILDMNDAADEVVEVASAVISRLIFERLRKSDPRNSYPVHVILEEAHRYVADRSSGFSMDASKVFERIAKEGRKYGMFLILASQRPSELSSTVLSQCSNFVVHRIQNPDDLHHIRQMTPFISDSVLRRLPSLPKQHALIFGSAVNLPTTFRVRNVLPKPKSDDARIRDLWFKD
jgi:DNA helicase HerA-like ATPase